MNKRKLLNSVRSRRKKRNPARLVGFSNRPRLTINRSNTSTYAQLIDDTKGQTIVSASSREMKNEKKSKTEKARMVGELMAKRAVEKGVKKVVFDRRKYRYHGRVRAFAEGARNAGLNF